MSENDTTFACAQEVSVSILTYDPVVQLVTTLRQSFGVAKEYMPRHVKWLPSCLLDF